MSNRFESTEGSNPAASLDYLCSIQPEVARFLFTIGATPDIFSTVLYGDDSYVERLLNANPDLIDARINQSFFLRTRRFFAFFTLKTTTDYRPS